MLEHFSAEGQESLCCQRLNLCIHICLTMCSWPVYKSSSPVQVDLVIRDAAALWNYDHSWWTHVCTQSYAA